MECPSPTLPSSHAYSVCSWRNSIAHPLLSSRVCRQPHNALVSFGSVTEQLLARYQLFQKNVEQITLVYDKGNNSQDLKKDNRKNLLSISP